MYVAYNCGLDVSVRFVSLPCALRLYVRCIDNFVVRMFGTFELLMRDALSVVHCVCVTLIGLAYSYTYFSDLGRGEHTRSDRHELDTSTNTCALELDMYVTSLRTRSTQHVS